MRKGNICGLHNIGNTCYMNSVLQVLVHNKFLYKYFTNKEFSDGLLENIYNRMKKEKKSCSDKRLLEMEISMTITYQLYRLIISMLGEEAFHPISFKKLVSCKNPIFSGYSQNDCHEFLNFIIDTIHEETKCSVSICSDSFPKDYYTFN